MHFLQYKERLHEMKVGSEKLIILVDKGLDHLDIFLVRH